MGKSVADGLGFEYLTELNKNNPKSSPNPKNDPITTTRGSSPFDLWRLSFLATGVRISPASSMTYVRRLVNCMASMLRDTDISSRIGAAGFLFSSHVR